MRNFEADKELNCNIRFSMNSGFRNQLFVGLFGSCVQARRTSLCSPGSLPCLFPSVPNHGRDRRSATAIESWLPNVRVPVSFSGLDEPEFPSEEFATTT